MDGLRRRHGTGGISYQPLKDEDDVGRELEPLIRSSSSRYDSSSSSSSQVLGAPISRSTALQALLGDSLQNFLRLFNLLLEYIFHPFSSRSPPFELTPLEKEALEAFKTRTALAYNPESTEHERLLFKLWQLAFPDDFQSCAPVSKKWKRLGFQNENPASDFRGVGVFGLSNLIYFAERYPAQFDRAVADRNSDDFNIEQYPFAIAGLNITMLLFETLGWGFKAKLNASDPYPPFRTAFIRLLLSQPATSKASTTTSSPARPPVGDLLHFDELPTEQPSSTQTIGSEPTFKEVSVFEEVYCAAFMILDREWTKAKASYMQFPIVLQTTREKLEALLPSFTSLDDVVRHNRREAGIIH